MSDLILNPGPVLLCCPCDAEPFDVTDRAHQFVQDLIVLAPETTLADVLGLLSQSSVLRALFWSETLTGLLLGQSLEKAELSAVTNEGPESLEYLEIKRCWSLESSTGTYSGLHSLELSGIGFELKEDFFWGEETTPYKAGSRVAFSVSLTPVAEMLTLPVRYQPLVRVVEGDQDSTHFMRPLPSVTVDSLTLGELISTVVDEVTCYGGEDARAELKSRLEASLAEAKRFRGLEKAGSEEKQGFSLRPASHSLDDLVNRSYRDAFLCHFETLGGYSLAEVYQVLGQVPDDVQIQNGLRTSDGFDTRGAAIPRVKGAFAELTAREFRKSLREFRNR